MVQLPAKISAKDSPMTARTPQRMSAWGACSREHAPQALMRWGVRAVIGESFAEIFAGNCTMLGIPTATVSQADMQKLQALAKAKPQTQFKLDLDQKVLFSEGKEHLKFEIHESK